MIFIEYRAQYREVRGHSHGIAFSPSLDRIKEVMAFYNIVSRYMIEGFDGVLWQQIEKTKDYDLN
jgi:hypothetical protein